MTLSIIQKVSGLLIYGLAFAKGYERRKEKALLLSDLLSLLSFVDMSRECLKTQGVPFFVCFLEENVITI